MVCGATRGGDGGGAGVDRDHLGGDVFDAGRVEQAGERDAAGAQIGFVITNPDIVKRLAAQDGNVHRVVRRREFV